MSSCSDSEAQEAIAARERFTQAAALVEQAMQGYVPKGKESAAETPKPGDGGQGDPFAKIRAADLRAYQQSLLTQAASALEPALGRGSERQKAASKRLMSELLMFESRVVVASAMDQWGDLAGRGANLLNYKTRVGNAQTRIRLLESEDDRVLSDLRRSLMETQQQMEGYRGEAASLRDQTMEMASRAERRNAQADQQFAQSKELEARAFTAEGDAQYELYDQAAIIMKQADETTAEAQRLEIQRDHLARELETQEALQRQAERSLRSIQDQIEQIEQARRRELDERDEAFAAKRTSASRLEDEFKQYLDDYTNLVAQPFEEAVTKAERAEKLASEAVGLARGTEPENVQAAQLERLARMVQRTEVLTARAVVVGSHESLLGALRHRAREMGVQSAGLTSTAPPEAGASHKELVEQVTGKIEESLEMAEKLRKGLAENDPFAVRVSEQVDILVAYRDQIQGLGDDEASILIEGLDGSTTTSWTTEEGADGSTTITVEWEMEIEEEDGEDAAAMRGTKTIRWGGARRIRR